MCHAQCPSAEEPPVGKLASADGLLALRALEFVTLIEKLATCQDVIDHFSRAMGEFGYDSYIMTALDERDFTQRVMASGWDPEWVAIHTDRKLKDADPVRRHVLRSVNPCFWTEAPYDRQREPRAKEVMDLAADFRMKEGFCVPIREGGSVRAVSVAGDKPDSGPIIKSVLHIISLFTYCRFRALINPALPPSHSLLTYREREALRWVSIGKSDWDISTILHISERTARAHVANAMHKLKAANRTAAVTEALSRGEIPLNY